MRFQVSLLAFSVAGVAQAANSWIVPGAAWMSTSNTKIDAHGGMVYKQGSTFYWVGQSASHSIYILLLHFQACCAAFLCL